MKRNILIFSLLAISALATAKPIRVGTYNLWRSDIGKEEYRWENRKDKLVKSIIDCNMDIFAAEEVDTTIFREIPALLAEGGAKYSWWNFSPYNSEGKGAIKAQAVIYKTDRFKMLESHHFWYSETPEKMSSGWDEMKFKRGGCCFIFKDKQNGRKFFVMVSHMPLGREANYEAAKIVLQMAKKYNPKNLPAFFMGDLNTREERNSSQLLRTYFTDSYLTDATKVGPKGTFNNHGVNKNMDEAPRIDFVYFRGMNIKPLKYTVNTLQYGGIYPSDHCPVYVDFEIGK